MKPKNMNTEESRAEQYMQNPKLIGKDISNNTFNWKSNSWLVAQYAPEHFDSEKYNWEFFGYFVPMHCPEHFDAAKYNWTVHSGFLAESGPQFLDAEKFNWEVYSGSVIENCPEHFDATRYNWNDEGAISYFLRHLHNCTVKEAKSLLGKALEHPACADKLSGRISVAQIEAVRI